MSDGFSDPATSDHPFLGESDPNWAQGTLLSRLVYVEKPPAHLAQIVWRQSAGELGQNQRMSLGPLNRGQSPRSLEYRPSAVLPFQPIVRTIFRTNLESAWTHVALLILCLPFQIDYPMAVGPVAHRTLPSLCKHQLG